ncbi:MAG: serine/threonine protein kinase, partial [Gammaproteobacteria bacterium]|nr:serine/threonine protein kinase [Gammaproteobacteria bacterium]
MSSSRSGNNAAIAPESVSQAIASFADGDAALPDVRKSIVGALEDGPDTAEAIHDLLDEQLKSRTLTIAEYGELVDALGNVLSENVPTEFSEDTPGESGIYRVVGEGTLVLTEDDAFAEVADDDAAARPEQSDQTRPFEDQLPEGVAQADDEIGVGSILRDRYRLEEEVARGAMGIVYRAADTIKLDAGATDPYLAVKVVTPEFSGNEKALRAFQNEVANTQHLSHPHIIHLFELDQDDGRYFITMEWLKGESLATLLDDSRESALNESQTYSIIEQLCSALAYAHEQNVVHADVKPGNVFLLDSGDIKLIDFGIAKSELGNATSQDHESVALTPAYASCERLEKAEPTPQDDLYSLACVIYRLLAGRRVYGPLTALEAEAQQAEVVRIPGMGGDRHAALIKALSFRREDRQRDVREFMEQFGRRIQPRDSTDDKSPGPLADDDIEVPLHTDTDTELVRAEELQPEIEVDFAFAEEAADQTEEPELSGIFAAAASGDTDVLEDASGHAAAKDADGDKPGEVPPSVSQPAITPLAKDDSDDARKVVAGLSAQQLQL